MTFPLKTTCAGLFLALSTSISTADTVFPDVSYSMTLWQIDLTLPVGNQHGQVEQGGWDPNVIIRETAETTCGAEDFEYMVGSDPSLSELPDHAVVIRADMPRATILVPGRLNLVIDDAGTVSSVFCG